MQRVPWDNRLKNFADLDRPMVDPGRVVGSSFGDSPPRFEWRLRAEVLCSEQSFKTAINLIKLRTPMRSRLLCEDFSDFGD